MNDTQEKHDLSKDNTVKPESSKDSPEKLELTEDSLANILLCDPITGKGLDALTELGLSKKDVSPSFFLKEIRANSRFDNSENAHPCEDTEHETHLVDKDVLFYQYSVSNVQMKTISGEYAVFNEKYCSNNRDESPLVLLGVAGNGKTIEASYRISKYVDADKDFICGKAYINLEVVRKSITYGVRFVCPDYKNPMWIFCTKLLESIMLYLRECIKDCPKIARVFSEVIAKNNLAIEEEEKLFAAIAKYETGDRGSEKQVFANLKALINYKNADESVDSMLRVLEWIMYCSDTNRLHYLIFDNFEQYVKLDGKNIQIPNSAIPRIYHAILSSMDEINQSFERINEESYGSDEGWKHFKIILIMRRTSQRFLKSFNLQIPIARANNIADITGHFPIESIWINKKKHIWESLLKGKRYTDDNNTNLLIDIMDTIMGDDEASKGTSYQDIIAPLMSYGIRRNGRAQAHAAYQTFSLITETGLLSINAEKYKEIQGKSSSAQYMFRRALIEFQFKWPMGNGDIERWKELGIGHPAKESKITIKNRKVLIHDVDYYDQYRVTFVRRILTYLSRIDGVETQINATAQKSVIEMFSTVSLFDLIKNVIANPFVPQEEISNDDMLAFARVLISLSNMLNKDTKSAPYIILGINEQEFHDQPTAGSLATLLQKIWQAGEINSSSTGRYNLNEFGVRLTDAGNSFLLDWQASFSFMAALYCFTIPPLFFLTDVYIIEYVIKTVYEKADKLCDKYESEAYRYCGHNRSLSSIKYFRIYNGEHVSYRKRVQILHVRHLTLYKDYIEKHSSSLGINQRGVDYLTSNKKRKEEIVGVIPKYIDKYEKWDEKMRNKECF